MQQINSCTCEQELLHYIDSLSLVMVDIALFLDTHPCDKEALETYQHYKSMLKDARSEYTECYGPLLKTDVNCENYWTWIERPWPWE